ncbi:MAG: hypothetical protein ACOYNS_03545 [Bacteroidota bacterium]
MSFGQRLKISAPSRNEVSMMTRQAVIISGKPGTKVVLYVNGAAIDTGAVRPDGVYDFLNISVHQGPVLFKVVSDELFPQIDSVSMHIAGEPNSIEILSAQKEFIADGKSKVNFEAVVKDKFGVAIPGLYFISLKSDTGSIVAEDVDPNQTGIQAKIENGKVKFAVASPSAAVVSTIQANWGSVSASREIEFNTPIVPLMIVGSADASGTMLSTSGTMTGVMDKDKIDAGFHSEGRLAFYGRGTIMDKYLLTASYDNERRQRDRLFRDLDPDVLYSIYGDNSRVDYTAQTSNPFFVKLELNRSYMMFGDFNTAFSQNELSRYDRTFTGVKGHFESRTGKADAFATMTDRKVVQDEIRGQGISGYYFLGSSNVVPGSEKIRIETREKRHNEVILNRAEKSRFGDYEIDYVQGTLFFKQPVQSIDNAGNPVYIIVSYESQSGFPTNYVTGLQGEQEVVRGLKVGVTAVTEERAPTNYTLLGFNTSYNYEDKLNTAVEVARGSDVSNSGAAWKVELGASPLKRMNLKSYFRKVESGFVNQTAGAGGAAEIGSTKYGVGGTYDGLFETKLVTDYYRQEQFGGNSKVSINSINGGIERKISSFANVVLRAENLQYESERTDTVLTDKKNSTLLSAKTTVRATDKINFTGEYEQSFSDSKKEQVKPSNAAIGMEYRILNNVSLSVQQRFYIGSGNTTMFGLASDVGYGTSVTGRYEIGSGINGQRNQASIGLKNTTKITDDVTGNISFERTRALDRNIAEAKTSDNDALSLGFEYLPKAAYKAAIKAEFAKNPQAIRRSVTFGGDIRLASDFTLLDKMTYFEEDRSASQIAGSTFADGALSSNQIGTSLGGGLLKKFDNAIGIAYRPVEFDWLNAIGKYEKKMEFNGVVMPQTSYDVNIVSIHTFVEPIVGLEIGTKYAMKFASEEAFGLKAATFTDFYLVRAEYDLRWNNFDVAAEYRILNSRIVDQANSSSIKRGYSAEVGNVVFENIRLAAGYNFVGTADRDLVGKDYQSAGPFISVRAKFTEKILNLFNK